MRRRHRMIASRVSSASVSGRQSLSNACRAVDTALDEFVFCNRPYSCNSLPAAADRTASTPVKLGRRRLVLTCRPCQGFLRFVHVECSRLPWLPPLKGDILINCRRTPAAYPREGFENDAQDFILQAIARLNCGRPFARRVLFAGMAIQKPFWPSRTFKAS